jgi:hypothetical protein
MATIRLRERERGIIAADTATNARESLTRCVVARAPTKAVCVAELDQRCILERRTQRWLVVPRCLARHWKSLASVALEDDIAGTVFRLLVTATAEEKCETARLVLSRCRDVEPGERAFIVGRDYC